MDYLSEKQKTWLLESLIQSKTDITKVCNSAKQDAKPVDLDLPIGRLSRMDAMQQQKMVEANIRQMEIRLLQIDKAIKLYKEGDYGYCRLCDGEIGFARLSASPEAAFCLECQKERESRL